jgi:hypothetical protein
MNKYIIEIPDDVQYVLLNGQTDNKCYTAVRPVAELEVLNSDYINEHYGELQDEAYQKGFEDGKNSIDMGCEGCRYSLRFAKDEPCKSCSNCYKSKYEPMPKEDDRIEVGDVVDRYIDGKFDSRGIYLQEEDGYWRCLFDTNGVLMTFAYPKGQFKKTGKHYDIQSILEAMRK